jgi:serine/threonine protein kinase
MTGDLLGTLRYMSPEQLDAKPAAVDHRTDIYSLGATLYELLTLRPAFSDDDRAGLLRRIAIEPPHSPRKLARSIPIELETIALKALEKTPSDRYQTAGELADDLTRFLEHRPIRARRSRVIGHAKALWRRHQALIVMFLITLLVASSVASVLVWQQRQEPSRSVRWPSRKAPWSSSGRPTCGSECMRAIFARPIKPGSAATWPACKNCSTAMPVRPATTCAISPGIISHHCSPRGRRR